ncbi:angiogenic factor with G patch and FHA domains 1 isoform X1 [Drosophila subpulchrella]|uniref:angiogenic factor with G patch and FHA domains 1 isoform X1 n=1 Tax=Drosophila subpulchrella TaxID=1486046 RepID=UPI0018A19A12|nr:angiogenic factor with G patch and FHA domains 1 isoform X1 [Drosophila subpulchrella]
MSPAEEEESADGAADHDFIELKSMEDLESCEPQQLLQYVEKLHGIIRKYDTKLAAYKQKLLHFVRQEEKTCCDKAIQLNESDFQENLDSLEKDEDADKKDKPSDLSATDAFSFVDEMRQAAKHAENLNNFVYEPTSGLYYDHKTGYYYNAEYGLYYDGNTGCYYSYDHAKDSYEFHSQAQVQANEAAKPESEDEEVHFDELGGVITDPDTLKKIKADKQKAKDRAEKSKRKAKGKKKSKKHSKKKRKKDRHHKSKKRHRDSGDEQDEDAEEGELSQSSDSSSDSSDNEGTSGTEDTEDSSVPIFKAAGRFQDIAKKYPPSLRVIVQETNLEALKVGSLHLITYKGGSLGREGAHDVIIPDVNVSKCHLKFKYEAKLGLYKCLDLGSRNGTILNGSPMSSDAMDLVHGSVIILGQTKLLCHVHEGNSTCGLCEPGLLIETPPSVVATAGASTATVLSHKEQLKKLQRKYGLENEKFVEPGGNGQSNYNDRAATRRVKVGSSTDKEKTEVACVNTEIGSSNKGFKMLSKLGWQKGDTLGKTNASTGLLAPISVVGNEGTSGLGNSDPVTSSSRPVDKRKLANLKITQARYQRANDIFVQSDDSD